MSPSEREIHFHCPNCNHAVTLQADPAKPLQACTRCGQLIRVTDAGGDDKPVNQARKAKQSSTQSGKFVQPVSKPNEGKAQPLSTSFDDLNLDYLDSADVVASSTMSNKSVRQPKSHGAKNASNVSQPKNEGQGKAKNLAPSQKPRSGHEKPVGTQGGTQGGTQTSVGESTVGETVSQNSSASGEKQPMVDVSLAAPIPPPFVPTPPALDSASAAVTAPHPNVPSGSQGTPQPVDRYQIPKTPPRPKPVQPPVFDPYRPSEPIELSMESLIPDDATADGSYSDPEIYYPQPGIEYPNQGASPVASGYGLQPRNSPEPYSQPSDGQHPGQYPVPMTDNVSDEYLEVPGLEILDGDVLGLTEAVDDSGRETSEDPNRIVAITCRICDTRQYRKASASEVFKCEVCFAPMKMSSRHMPFRTGSNAVSQQRSRSGTGDLGQVDDRSLDYMVSESTSGDDEVDDLIRTVKLHGALPSESSEGARHNRSLQAVIGDGLPREKMGGESDFLERNESEEYRLVEDSGPSEGGVKDGTIDGSTKLAGGTEAAGNQSLESDVEDELRLQPIEASGLGNAVETWGRPGSPMADELPEIVDEISELEVIESSESSDSQSTQGDSESPLVTDVKPKVHDSLFLDGADIPSRPEPLLPSQQLYQDRLNPPPLPVEPVNNSDGSPVAVRGQSGGQAYNDASPRSAAGGPEASHPGVPVPPPFYDPNYPGTVRVVEAVSEADSVPELSVFERPFFEDWLKPFQSFLLIASILVLMFGMAIGAAVWTAALDPKFSILFRVVLGFVAFFVTSALVPVLFWLMGTVANRSYRGHSGFRFDYQELFFFLLQYSSLLLLGCAGAVVSIPFANLIVTGLFVGLSIFLPGLVLLTNATYRRTTVCLSDSAVNRSFIKGADEWYKSFGVVGTSVTFGLFIGIGCTYMGWVGAVVFSLYTLVAFFAFATQVGRLAEVVWTLEQLSQPKA